ncbi:MAG: hypothetical protein AAF050_02050 [Cyanobacteria bacterium J06649_5]
MYSFSITEDSNGEIRIDSFRERFPMDFSFWDKADYQSHWQQASTALKAEQAVSFIQSMYPPETANFYRAWVAYPCNDEVIFQEQMLFIDELEGGFNTQHPHLNAQRISLRR